MSRRDWTRILAAGIAVVAGGHTIDPAWVLASDTRPPASVPRVASNLRPLEDWLQVLVATDPHWRYESDLALDAVSAERRAEFRALQPILSDTLQHQFLGLSNDRLRREWMRRYWALRDPTPTTAQNERLEEHLLRVAHAREHYGRPVAPFWDARGEFCVQVGIPQHVYTDLADSRIGVGYVPKRETWIYEDGDFVIGFEQGYPGAPWQRGGSRVKQSNRRDLLHDATVRAHDPWRADPDAPTLAELAPDARNFLDATTATWDEIAAARIAEEHMDRFEMPGPPRRFVPYVFDADVFRGAPQRPRVEVHLQFDLSDLEFRQDISGWIARYLVEGVLLDDSVRVVARTAYQDSVRVDTAEMTEQSILWPGQLNFTVPPGNYRLALRVADLETQDEGLYAADVGIPSLDAPELLLSDLELATRIDSIAPNVTTRFAKNQRLVVPNPIATYGPERQLTGYFEIYGLKLDAKQRSRYEVTYTFVPRAKLPSQGFFPSTKPQEVPVVSSTFTAEGRDTTAIEVLRVDIGSLPQDTYDLLLTVRDLQAGTTAQSRTWFKVAREK